MTVEQAQEKLIRIQEEIRRWYVQNTSAEPPSDLLKRQRELAAWIEQHKE